MIYVEIENNIPIKSTSNADIANKYFKNFILTDYDDYTPANTKYMYENGQISLNPDYEAEQIEQERARIMNLSLTKADVLLALYEDKGLSPDDIKAMLKDNIPALIKFDYASSYYRGDDVVIALGKSLGYSEEDIDYLFEHKKLPEKI